MSVFGAYSRYYNLLYKDKDYADEALYVHDLIRKYRPDARSILDLGCGTGRHDFELANHGYSVFGVDRSDEMLGAANARLAALRPATSALSFHQGDIRSVRLDRTFDVVLSLFHVMSYQGTNEDLLSAFATAEAHLKPGGIFIFDCWYGPAVLADPPVVRVKRLEDDDIQVVRIAEPVLHCNENAVDVNYHVLIIDKSTGKVEQVRETHRMRYLFLPELEDFIKKTGMTKLFASEWMTGRAPGCDTWGVCVGLTKG